MTDNPLSRLLDGVPRRIIEDGGDMLYHGKRTAYLAEADVLAALSAAPVGVRHKALVEAEKALRDWKDDLNANRMHETADTVGMAAAVVRALIEKDTK